MRAEHRAALQAELDVLTDAGRLRQRPVIDSPNARVIVLRERGRRRKLLNWASNDYLGSALRLPVRNAATRALRQYGSGAGAARLLAGGLRCHARLEQRLAGWLASEDALLCSTGYQCNLAVLGALIDGERDAIVLDRLCHASLYDGARLSGGKLARFAHNDVDDLARRLRQTSDARRRLVCVESVYSMDGDEAPLREIAACCAEHDALLLVDEAHALGVFGPGGRGLCAELGVEPDALIGTCSKSFGAQGGFVVGARELIALILNRGRAFIFSTAPAPAATGAAVAVLDLLKAEPAMGAELQARAGALRRALQRQGWDLPDGRSPIIPLLVGDEATALDLAARLRERGHFAPAIRPPTVPPGACRLRLSLTLAHRKADRRRLVEALGELR